MKKHLIVLAAAVLSLASCTKEFDIINTGTLSGSEAAQMVEQDPAFLSSYVNGFYSWLVSYGGSHDMYGHLSCLSNLEIMCKDVAINGTWNFGRYDINHDYGAEIWGRTSYMWNIYFTLIKNCNEVIDFFGAEDPVNGTLKGYLGEAYALRAFAYTYLMLLYQDPVEGSTPNAKFRSDAPAVPIVYATRDGFSTEEANAVSGRNTLADVMNEVERNIALALPLLEGYERSSKNEVNYQVAQGIAARYYLFTQQWDKAITAARAAQEGFDLMDESRLKSGFMEIEDNEVLWGFDHNAETSTVYASFFSHWSNESPGYGGIGQSVHCIDRSLYDQIPSSDYRKALFNGADGDPAATTTGAKLAYASRKFGYAPNWLQDYIFMRKAEMILIEAESHARLGDGQAAAALKPLMAARDPQWSGSEVTVDDVLLQRRIELWGEGFSYYDLRRNGLGVDRKYDGTNHAVEAQRAFPAHTASWNFQIPLSEIQNNVNISEDEQNEWVSGAA